MQNYKINNNVNLFEGTKVMNDEYKFNSKKDLEYDIFTNERYGGWADIIVKKNTLLYKYLRENTLKEDK